MRRSSADGRDAYYRVDLVRCHELLGIVGRTLHPALGVGATTARAPRRTGRVGILFACTGNSSRSQLAEAFARHLAPDSDVFSAGSDPKPIHPQAIRVANEYGLDLRGARSKHLDEFRHASFDYVVTLCDRVREVCPEFDGAPELIHWSIPDPAEAIAGRASYPRFQAAAADIRTRVEFLLEAIPQYATEGGVHAG
jgi:protein-tyrosine-phosphatase